MTECTHHGASSLDSPAGPRVHPATRRVRNPSRARVAVCPEKRSHVPLKSTSFTDTLPFVGKISRVHVHIEVIHT